MNSSARIYILMKVADLSKRMGLAASDTDAYITFVDNKDCRKTHQEMRFENQPTDPVVAEKFERFMTALGCDEDGIIKADSLNELEERVEQALALAPRSWSRS